MACSVSCSPTTVVGEPGPILRRSARRSGSSARHLLSYLSVALTTRYGQRWAGDAASRFPMRLAWMLSASTRDAVGHRRSESPRRLRCCSSRQAASRLLAPSWLLLAAPTVVAQRLVRLHSRSTSLVNHYHLGHAHRLLRRRRDRGRSAPQSLGRAGTSRRDRNCRHRAGPRSVRRSSGRTASRNGRARAEPTRGSSSTFRRTPRSPRTRSLVPHLSHRVEVCTLPEPFVPTRVGRLSHREELR